MTGFGGSLVLSFIIFFVFLFAVAVPLIALYFCIKHAVKNGVIDAYKKINTENEK